MAVLIPKSLSREELHLQEGTVLTMKIFHSQGVEDEEAPLMREEEVEAEGLIEALLEVEASVVIEGAEASVVIGEEATLVTAEVVL